MAGITEIRGRMRSIQQTLKITNAMYLISSAKVKKARKQLQEVEPYFDRLAKTILDIFRHSPQLQHRYIEGHHKPKEERKTGFVVITGDKGLAGAYNHNVLKLAESYLARKQDWLPRQVRQKVTRLNRAVEELSVKLGREPESQEVADYLGLTREQYDALASETAVTSLVSFEAVLDACGSMAEKSLAQGEQSNPPQEEFENREFHNVLAQKIAGLREKERLVLSLYYEKELNMKEIAQVLGVSAARVSQIHSRALEHLRTEMQAYLDA